MKKRNKLDLSSYKKITDLNLLEERDGFFIAVDSDGNNSVIDAYGNRKLPFFYENLSFFSKKLVISTDDVYNDYLRVENLENGKVIKGRICLYKDFILKNDELKQRFEIFNHNLNQIFHCDKLSPSAYEIVDENNHVLSKFKCDELKVIDENRFLIKKRRRSYIVDRKNKILCKINISHARVEVDRNSGLIFLCCGHNYPGSGFINTNNSVINIDFNDYEVINNDTIIIKKDNDYLIIDSNGNKKIDDTYSYVSFYSNFNIIKVKKDDKYGILDINLNVIIKNEYDNIFVINENFYLVDFTKIINREDKIIYENSSLNDFKKSAKGKLITLKKNNSMMLLDISGNVIIPFVENNILIINDNKILVDNYLIDLKEEYLKLNVNYELEIFAFGNTIIRSFRSKELRDKAIHQISCVTDEYLRKINSILSDDSAKEKIKGK